MSAIKGANLALRFLLEMALLVVFAFWGFHLRGSFLLRVGLGLGIPILLAVFWSVFMAPRSPRRASGIGYILLETLIFGLASVALIAAGQPVFAAIFASITVLNAVSLHLSGPTPDVPPHL
jgi:hypothetical protein